MKNTVNSKNKKYTLLAWVLALLVLAVAVPINLIFDRLNYSFDMTPNRMYTLSKTTTDYLDELDARGEVVDVYFLQKMEVIESDLELLALYRTLLAYDEHPCFHLVAFDPDTDPQTLKSINPENKYNLSQNDFLFVHGDMVKRLPATMMYTYETDENDKVIGAEFRAENYFTGYMKSVVDGEIPTVYFLEGHGEVPLTQMTKLSANLGNYNYATKQLNLINAENVPEDCCILVIAGPTSDITDEEREKIDDYTQTGGNIMMLMTPNEAKVAYTNLSVLMADFCLAIEYDRVYETDTARHKSGDPYTFMCDLVPVAEDSGDEDLTSELLAATNIPTYMPASRSLISLYSANYTTCSIGTQIRTATTACAEPYGGTLDDADPVTGKQLNLAMHSKDSLRNDAKLALFGTAEFITDEGASNEFFIMPLQLFLSTVTWMYNSDVDMNIANKERTYDSISVNSSEEASGLIALFVAVPLVVAAAGIIIWLRRKDA